MRINHTESQNLPQMCTASSCWSIDFRYTWADTVHICGLGHTVYVSIFFCRRDVSFWHKKNKYLFLNSHEGHQSVSKGILSIFVQEQDFGETSRETIVCGDLITNYPYLFDVDMDELDKVGWLIHVVVAVCYVTSIGNGHRCFNCSVSSTVFVVH